MQSGDPETETLSVSPQKAARTTNSVIELPNCSCMKTGLFEPVFVLTNAHTGTHIHAESKTGHCTAQEPELILPSRRLVRESQT